MNYVNLKKYTRSMSILLVEDDIDFKKEFEDFLYEIFPYIKSAKDGKDGIYMYNEYFRTTGKNFDLIITDIQMPNINGIEFIKEIYKKNINQQIVVVSARKEFYYLYSLINLKILHLFTKPINIDNFLSVIYNISREYYYNNLKIKDNNHMINIAESLKWNKIKCELSLNNEVLYLTKQETTFLKLLFENINDLLTYEKIYINLWENNYLSTNKDGLKNLISKLRRKIPMLKIKNIHSMGYKLDKSSN